MSNATYPKVGVGVIVFRDIGGKRCIMMHQRKGLHGAGYWGTGGGHLRVGESLMGGALRELREEAGEALKVKDMRFLSVMNFTEFKPKHYVDVSFSAEWVSGEPQNIEPDKTTTWQWVSLDTLPSPIFPPVEVHLRAAATGEKFFDSHF